MNTIKCEVCGKEFKQDKGRKYSIVVNGETIVKECCTSDCVLRVIQSSPVSLLEKMKLLF